MILGNQGRDVLEVADAAEIDRLFQDIFDVDRVDNVVTNRGWRWFKKG